MATSAPPQRAAAPRHRLGRTVNRLPPASFFLVSAVFHYLGPSLAVLLFTHVAALGVMWLRIAGQIPTTRDLAGIALVIAGVATHQAGPGQQNSLPTQARGADPARNHPPTKRS